MLEAATGFILGWFFGWIITPSIYTKTYSIKLREQDGTWYAFEKTKGLVVKAETREAAINKMREALGHA